MVRSPFASACDDNDLDFNEVFFNDARVPAENLVGPLNEGWRVANGSLGHERNMLWLSYADRLQELVEDYRRPAPQLDRDRYATLVMDNQALRLLGSIALARAARGDEDAAALSVLKLFGSEASQSASEYALTAAGPAALGPSRHLRPILAVPSRPLQVRLVRALPPVFRRHHRRRHLRNPTQHHRPATARAAPQLKGSNVYIDYEVRDRIATITLNRPEAANAQNPELLDELDAAWTRAAEDTEVSVIVLRANGKHFSAGHDLRGGGPVPDKITLEFIIQHEAKRYLEYTLRWRNVPKPSIAAVQGRCISGGLLLCWPCDLIIAADDAQFSDPVVLMGIGGVEYHGHTWELGPRKAKEILFTGRAMTAEEVAEHRDGQQGRAPGPAR